MCSDHLKSAELLTSFGCDLESWTKVDNCEETLLHHMMDINDPVHIDLQVCANCAFFFY